MALPHPGCYEREIVAALENALDAVAVCILLVAVHHRPFPGQLAAAPANSDRA